MGRRYWNRKDIVEECRAVSITFLRKHNYLSGWQSGTICWKNSRGEDRGGIGITVCIADDDSYAKFFYTSTSRRTGEKTECDYKVQLVTTPCNLGGRRWWFICPRCGRRVGILHCPPGATYYGCRHCYDLSYESRNECRHGRLAYMSHYMALIRQRDQLMRWMGRWTYRGVPTRKARRLHVLTARMNAYGRMNLSDLLSDGLVGM